MFCILKAMASPAMVSLRESLQNSRIIITEQLQNCYKIVTKANLVLQEYKKRKGQKGRKGLK